MEGASGDVRFVGGSLDGTVLRGGLPRCELPHDNRTGALAHVELSTVRARACMPPSSITPHAC